MLLCRPPTLIPRPETAHIFTRLAERILSSGPSPSISQGLRVVDLCTGSAAIPLLLSKLLGAQCQAIVGYDYHDSAISLAKDNIEKLAAEGDAGQTKDIKVYQADIFEKYFARQILSNMNTTISEEAGQLKLSKVDVLVSNPPYITRQDWQNLPVSVKEFEDPRALIGDLGTDHTSPQARKGVVFYERIAELVPDILSSPASVEQRGWKDLPRVAVEIGEEQGEDVKSIFGNVGIKCEVWKDQYERDRMVIGWHR